MKPKDETNKYDCSAIAAVPGVQPKLPLSIDEQGDFILTKDYNYILTRLNDGLVKRGDVIKYVEWNEDGTAKEMHDDIVIGRSLILEPRMSYTWLTTVITEVVEQRDGYAKFKTENSLYELKIS
jgi:hypothetical protein